MQHARHQLFAQARGQAVGCERDDPTGRALHDLFDRRATMLSIRAGTSVALEGDPADTLMRVRDGMLRCCTYSVSGRRQVLRFAGPCAVLGIVAVAAQGWPYGVEACAETIVDALPRRVLDGALAADADLLAAIHVEATAEIAQRDRTLCILAEPRAELRLLEFLADLSGPARHKSGAAGQKGAAAPAPLTLAMSRRDIADHLGLSHETVSRAFSALRRHGFIEMQGSSVVRLLGSPG